MPKGHINTGGADCGTCHRSTEGWGAAAHPAVTQPCATCHNGSIKGANSTATIPDHPNLTYSSVQTCDTCHPASRGFATWSGGKFHAYAQTTAACTACHSGGVRGATTKPTNHIPGVGSASCDSCHGSTASWATSVTMNHALVTGTACASCHGVTLAGVTPLGKPANHIPTGSSGCEACHKSTSSFVMSVWDHSTVGSARCDSCHTGSYLNALGTSSFPGHAPTNGNDCVSCHTATATTQQFTSWAGAAFSHATAAAGSCATCHNGTTATGKTSNHLPTDSSKSCDDCHKTFAGWTTSVTMNHGVTTTTSCSTCHTSSYDGVTPKAKPANHVSTNLNCSTCHLNTTSFTGGKYHKYVTTNGSCSTCHNDSVLGATGASNPPHIPIGAVDCASCHANTGSDFLTGNYTMNHGAVSGVRCDSCHNGSYTGEGSKGALGAASYSGHTATGGADCNTCHQGSLTRSFTSWSGATGHPSVTASTNCATCHNGTAQTGKPGNHVDLTKSNVTLCATCHPAAMGFSSWSGGKFHKYATSSAACATCHTGAVLGAMGKTTPPHIPTTADCTNCHANTGSDFLTGNYTMNHSVVSGARCDSCHNGTYASQGSKGALGAASYSGHTATGGADCNTCHQGPLTRSFTSWSGATGHPSVTASTNCATCHNGTTQTGKPGNHVDLTKSSVTLCATCHPRAMGFSSWSGGLFHKYATSPATCAACHTGAVLAAVGKTTPPHIPTTADCANCHTAVSAGSFATSYKMNHSAVSGSRCDSCHNGSYTTQGTSGAMAKPSGHVSTSQDCVTCHTSTGYTSWTGTGKYTHAAGDTNCSNCHNGTEGSRARRAITSRPRRSAASATRTPHHSFATYTMGTTGHAAVTGTCISCHSGTAFQGITPMAKPATGHIPTTSDCGTCHTSKTSFGTWTMNHSGITSNCSQCHGGSYAGVTTKPTGHVSTTADCSTCHKSTTSFSGAAYTHAAGDTNCSNCHNGTKATGKGSNHIATTSQCSTCHKNTASSFATYTMGTTGHAAVTGTCISCHTGQAFQGVTPTAKPATGHIPTSSDCGTCHTSKTSFGSWTMNHSGIASNCSQCHGGSYAGVTTKPTGHVSTTADCSTCHKSTTTFTGASYTHAAGDTNCSNCHTGSKASRASRPTTSPRPGSAASVIRARRALEPTPWARPDTRPSPGLARHVTADRRSPGSRRRAGPPTTRPILERATVAIRASRPSRGRP